MVFSGAVGYTLARPYPEARSMSLGTIPRFGFVLLILLLSIPGGVGAEEVALKPDHPERYTVRAGDTLWGIASRFLKSPWHWPKIWRLNEQIRNPHLIYPGDVVLLRYVDGRPELTLLRTDKVLIPDMSAKERLPEAPAAGRPTVKLEPRVYAEPLEKAIPTIPPSAIVPFLTEPRVVEEGELERAAYVTVGLDNRIALGSQSQFYARGVSAAGEYYHVFRAGKPIRHPDTGELLAYEALYLGDARLLEPGDPSKFIATRARQEILPRDRLIPAPPTAGLPYYYPKAPPKKVEGRIVGALNAVAEIGPYSVVTITLGKREGLEEGHVLRVLRHAGKQRDPVTREDYALPDEDSALILVFRTFEKVSYALVMTATRPVHVLDAVVTP